MYQITAASRLGGYRPQISVFYVICPQLNLLNPPQKRIPGYATALWSPIKEMLRFDSLPLHVSCSQYRRTPPGSPRRFPLDRDAPFPEPTFCHRPRSPTRTEGQHTMGWGLVPQGDRLQLCCYYSSATQPSARHLSPWLGLIRAPLASACRSNPLQVSTPHLLPLPT